jgi:hypothetical protein
VVAAVARPKTATSPAGRAAAELKERVKEKVAQDPRVAEFIALAPFADADKYYSPSPAHRAAFPWWVHHAEGKVNFCIVCIAAEKSALYRRVFGRVLAAITERTVARGAS